MLRIAERVNMKFRKYQKEAYVAIQEHEGERDEIANWAVGLSEEVGEVNGIIKHHLWAGEPIDKTELAKECGDVLWYLSALCTVVGIDLDAVAELNVAKLKHRYEDETYSVGRNQDRKALDVAFVETKKYQEIVERLELKK